MTIHARTLLIHAWVTGGFSAQLEAFHFVLYKYTDGKNAGKWMGCRGVLL